MAQLLVAKEPTEESQKVWGPGRMRTAGKERRCRSPECRGGIPLQSQEEALWVQVWPAVQREQQRLLSQ